MRNTSAEFHQNVFTFVRVIMQLTTIDWLKKT